MEYSAAHTTDNQSDFSQLFAVLDQKKDKLNTLLPLPVEEQLTQRDQFVLETAYNSNAIAGSSLTYEETAQVLDGNVVPGKSLKEHLDVVGHQDAYLYVEGLWKPDAQPLESEIKELHALVTVSRSRNGGVYRRVPVSIPGRHRQPSLPSQIPGEMHRILEDYVNARSSMHLLERIARFHLEFEGIHPFLEGNGKLGRLLMNLELVRNRYPAIVIKVGDQKRYTNAFEDYYIHGSADSMILLICRYVEQQLDYYLNKLCRDDSAGETKN